MIPLIFNGFGAAKTGPAAKRVTNMEATTALRDVVCILGGLFRILGEMGFAPPGSGVSMPGKPRAVATHFWKRGLFHKHRAQCRCEKTLSRRSSPRRARQQRLRQRLQRAGQHRPVGELLVLRSGE